MTRLFGACGVSGLAKASEKVRLKNLWKAFVVTGNGATGAVERLVKETKI